MASLPKNTIKHFTHPYHPLLHMYEDKEYICGGCKTIGAGWRYRCDSCDFDLHDHCATCPTTLSSFFMHPQHQLNRVVRNPQATIQNRPVCHVCRGHVEGLFYMCKICDFDVHPHCTLYPQKVRSKSHPAHLLTLHPSSASCCLVCKSVCTFWRYKCGICHVDFHIECILEPCGDEFSQLSDSPPYQPSQLSDSPPHQLPSRKICDFDLHPYCTLYPPNVRSKSHPAHLLTLQPSLASCCLVCKSVCTFWRYKCGICNVDFHIECILEPCDDEFSQLSDSPPHQLLSPPCGTSLLFDPICDADEDDDDEYYDGGLEPCDDEFSQLSDSPLYQPSQLSDSARHQPLSPPGSPTNGMSLLFDPICDADEDDDDGGLEPCDESSQLSDSPPYQPSQLSDSPPHQLPSRKICDFDVHPYCTLYPQNVRSKSHPAHLLTLLPSSASCCLVCKSVCTFWRYKCGICNIDFHIECILEPCDDEFSQLSDSPPYQPSQLSYSPPHQLPSPPCGMSLLFNPICDADEDDDDKYYDDGGLEPCDESSQLSDSPPYQPSQLSYSPPHQLSSPPCGTSLLFDPICDADKDDDDEYYDDGGLEPCDESSQLSDSPPYQPSQLSDSAPHQPSSPPGSPPKNGMSLLFDPICDADEDDDVGGLVHDDEFLDYGRMPSGFGPDGIFDQSHDFGMPSSFSDMYDECHDYPSESSIITIECSELSSVRVQQTRRVSITRTNDGLLVRSEYKVSLTHEYGMPSGSGINTTMDQDQRHPNLNQAKGAGGATNGGKKSKKEKMFALPGNLSLGSMDDTIQETKQVNKDGQINLWVVL